MVGFISIHGVISPFFWGGRGEVGGLEEGDISIIDCILSKISLFY